MDKPVSPDGNHPRAEETPHEREARLVEQFKCRLGCIFRSYRHSHEHRISVLSFNKSLEAAKQTLNPKARGKPEKKRVDPEFELLVNARALALARDRDPDASKITQNDVNVAATQLIKDLRPRRGRPSDTLLVHHVHAFLALYRQTCGADVRVSMTRDSVYDPHIKSPGAAVMLKMFSDIDPAVTTTALVNIILDAQALGAIEGKKFQDFFPFHEGHVDPETGLPVPGPGYRIERFEQIAPIYSS